MTALFTHKTSYSVFLLLLLATGSVWAQGGRPQPGTPGAATPMGTGDKVDLIHADSLFGVNQPGAVVRRLINNVKLQQKGIVLYCDLAIQNTTTNVIEAYGNVRMVQGDTITVRGDTLYYYGNTRQANVLGNVVLKDRKMTLSTARLDYNMLTGMAHYPVKGHIVDRENTLTSEEGDYYTGSKQFVFRRNVRLLNQPPGKEKTTILGDSLLYNSLSKIADFQGPTRIISKDGVLVARNGQYNTITRVSNFRQRATAETDKYTLTGDTLDFDNVNELGVAHGNVVLVNKADKTTLTGDHGRYNGKAGVSRMIGHAVVRSPISQGVNPDTLLMRADTLFSFDNKLTRKKKLVGLKNVLVFKSDLQSKCDSLVYDVNDSLLYFYKKPIVWSQNYQMEADSMTARLKNNRISVMFLKTKAFVISQDTLRNFNQVKGRQITAYFRTILAPVKKTGRPTGPITASASNRPTLSPIVTTTATAETTILDRVLVEGNGQTIYFAVDEKNRLVGMNRTECSKMNIEFTDSRVTRIRNYGRPDMYLTPPKELTDAKKQLDGFRWREKDKPTRAQTLGLTPLGEPAPGRPAAVVTALNEVSQPGAVNAVKPAALSALKRAGLTQPVLPGRTTPVLTATTSAAGKAVDKPAEATLNAVRAASQLVGIEPLGHKLTATKPGLPTVGKIPVRAPEPVAVSVDSATTALSATAAATLPISRQPLLITAVASLRPKPVRPVAVATLVITTKPVAPKPVVRPVAAAETPVMATEPVASDLPGRGSADKPAGASNPVAASSSSSTLPTRRSEKQQAATRLVPKYKVKTTPVRSVGESDLEQELNRKQKKQ